MSQSQTLSPAQSRCSVNTHVLCVSRPCWALNLSHLSNRRRGRVLLGLFYGDRHVDDALLKDADSEAHGVTLED